jgi:hypothetical protein
MNEMTLKKVLLLVGALIVATAILTACAGQPGPVGPAGPTGPEGPAGPAGPAPAATDLTCTECHNDAGIVTTKMAGWEVSKHGNGTAMAEEYGNKNCAFCHSGNKFREAIAAGTNFSNQETGAVEPARQDCYTCHNIHTTYTKDDFSLRTESAVDLVVGKQSFDGGAGNLCANCHQARRYMANFADKVDPTKFAPTARFNTHYSSQVDVMLGIVDVNAALGVEGKASPHMKVTDTCVGCHMGEGKNHTFKAEVGACVSCHSDATDTNVGGAPAELADKVSQLEKALLAKGLIAEGAEGYAAVPQKEATALDAKTAGAVFAYFLYEEDGSEGIHNPGYFNTLIDAALEAVK